MNKIIATLFFSMIFCGGNAQILNTNNSSNNNNTVETQRSNNTINIVDLEIPALNPKPIVVQSINAKMSKGLRAGFQLDVPEAEHRVVEDDFLKTIRNKTKSKFVKVGDEHVILQTMVVQISDKPLNAYAQLMKLDSAIRIICFFEEDDKFISDSTSAEKSLKAKTFLRAFAVDQYKKSIQKVIDSEKDKFSKLENELKKLAKENEKMHAQIKKEELTIENANMDLKSNLKEQGLNIDQILKEKTALVDLNVNMPQKKEIEKKISGLENTTKKLRSKNESLNKKIVKSRASIESNENKIKRNLEDQFLKKKLIDRQLAYNRGLEEKLGKIK